MARAQAILGPGYVVYQRGGLIAAPFVYLAVYMAVMAAIRLVGGEGVSDAHVGAAVYFLARADRGGVHARAQLDVDPDGDPGRAILGHDPLGLGWNLLGLPLMTAEPGSLQMGEVWHVEVALILAGHVASVYIAHLVALRVFPTRRQAGSAKFPC